MLDKITKAFNDAANEAKYQDDLRKLVNEARNAIRTIKTQRPNLHAKVDELARQGIVQDRYREHAVLDFDLGEYEKPATQLKDRAQRALMIRRLIYPQQEETKNKRSATLRRLQQAGVL